MVHQTKILSLKEAIHAECPHRDKSVARKPMPNFSSTPGGKNDTPLAFWASWELKDRPRRIALLLDDCQEEYRVYAEDIVPNLSKLVHTFRSKQAAIAWSVWSRTYDDGISNAMDRWYGGHGLNPDTPENAVYMFNGAEGMQPLEEIQPTPDEKAKGWYYHAKHLDMFWCFDENGKSYLDEKLKALDIDTIIVAGLWTDECITATSYAGNARGYDVIVVRDAVATATAHQEAALTILNGTVAKVLSTDDVIQYMKEDYVEAAPGQYKGKSHPDGRKDSN